MATRPVVLAGRSEAEHADVPVEIPGVPAEDEWSERRVALGELGIADVEIERSECVSARPGERGGLNADVYVHGDRARHDRDGVGAAKNLPRRHVVQCKQRRGIILIDADGDAPVEDRRVGAAVVMIDVGARIPARLRGKHSPKMSV